MTTLDIYLGSLKGKEKVSARAYSEAVLQGRTVRVFTWHTITPSRQAQIRRRVHACMFHDYVEEGAKRGIKP
jgi:hypothetical protein